MKIKLLLLGAAVTPIILVSKPKMANTSASAVPPLPKETFEVGACYQHKDSNPFITRLTRKITNKRNGYIQYRVLEDDGEWSIARSELDLLRETYDEVSCP